LFREEVHYVPPGQFGLGTVCGTSSDEGAAVPAASTYPEPPPVFPSAPSGPDRRLVIAVTVCAALGLGVPFSSSFLQLRMVVGGAAASETWMDHLWVYSIATALILSLLVLRRFPVRGWPWLLTAGSVLTLPLPLSIVDNEMFRDAPPWVITIPMSVGNTVAVFGLLGAAAWITRQSAGMGTALAATSITVPVVGALTLFLSLFGLSRGEGGWVYITLAVLALAGSISALVVSSFLVEAEPVRPNWRLTACGAFVALPPVIVFWINDGDADRGFLLVIGLIMVVPALLAALVAGWRVMLAALLIGLISVTAIQSSLYGFAFRAIGVSYWILLPLILVALAAGWLLAISRLRAWIGIAGLTICAFALLTTASSSDLFNTPRPSGSNTALAVAVIMIGIVAVSSAIAFVIGTLVEPQELPATFGAFGLAIQAGASSILAYVTRPEAFSASQGRTTTTHGITLLLIAIGLTALAAWQLRRTPPPPVPPAEDPEPLDADAVVVHRLPDA
jgi:hypothetical protein